MTAGGLVFVAATSDRKLRAFDKQTGALKWETTLPGAGYASPATFMLDEKQYLVISVTGNKDDPAGSIMAFALP